MDNNIPLSINGVSAYEWIWFYVWSIPVYHYHR
jgi:hypothetical protein